MAYAKKTDVPATKSRAEIEALAIKHGAHGFMQAYDTAGAMIAFQMKDRRVIFRLPLPGADSATKAQVEQETRRRWRALLLTIKAKLVSVEDGIETFEEAFLAHIMMPDGSTVGQNAIPRVIEAYDTGTMPPLLPPPPA